MSTDQPTLADSVARKAAETRAEARDLLADHGAVYGRSGTSHGRTAASRDRQCRSCGAPVSARFVRVFGSNAGACHACHECTEIRRLFAGAAAGVDS
jgi:hypothetical protein